MKILEILLEIKNVINFFYSLNIKVEILQIKYKFEFGIHFVRMTNIAILCTNNAILFQV